MLDGREWRKAPGASLDEIAQLSAVSPIRLPESYLQLLRFSNGGEGPLAVQPLWLQLYPIKEVIWTETSSTFSEDFPKLFAIGGNGGGEAIALDFRGPEPYPLVSFDMTNIDLSESIQTIATSFDAALELIGRDEGWLPAK